MKKIPKLIITPGEPAGIGPDIVIKIAQQKWPAQLFVIGDPDLLITRAQLLGLPLTLRYFETRQAVENQDLIHHPGSLNIIPILLEDSCQPGHLNTRHAKYVLHCLELATDYCLQGSADALVTGPVHKGVINEAGILFTGHTEFLADRCHVSNVLMLFVTDKMKVALTTIHLPLSQVAKAITKERLTITLRQLHSEIKKHFSIHTPKIIVCGLNPHAGENGYLGREELDIMIPVLKQMKEEGLNVIGPLPADTVFTQKYLTACDVVLAMYHDQALPVVKYQGFDHAVNVTLGLPIIRTSVDHGTALDIAGTRAANAGSLAAAIELAIQLVEKVF